MRSHALQEQKSHTNKKLMQNVHVVSRLKFHALSDGATVSPASQILCTGKWIELFTETVLAFNLHFQQFTGKSSGPFERVENWSAKDNILHLLCICT
jgi:hypothetical protein